MRLLKGQEAAEFTDGQIAAHSGGLESALAPLNAKHSFQVWLDTLRALEEFINIPLFQLDDDELERDLVALRLDCLEPNKLMAVKQGLEEKFGSKVAQRFLNLVVQASAIRSAFLEHGLIGPAAGLETVRHAIGYFQSRRGHLVTMLYSLPEACRGNHLIDPLDSLNIFLPQVEHSGMTLSGLHKKRVLAKIYPDFELTVEEWGSHANRWFDTLGAFFSEPERASILEMDQSKGVEKLLEPTDPSLVFSAAEVRNNIVYIENSYREFDLAGTRFGAVANFTRDCLTLCKDDYFIALSVSQFDEFADRAGLLKKEQEILVQKGGSYIQNLNTKAPFIQIGAEFFSTVTLLSRFLNHWKNSCLDRVKRYQIRSGFIFEETVKKALKEQGFHITSIKRINRKEFDVVAVLDDVIYNVQCKNNLIDLGKIEENPKLFVRYNNRLRSAYEAALLKEVGREHLLKKELGLSKIKHFVVSKFPVAMTNEQVLPYLSIDQFRILAGD